jgi:hypothetical protein
MLTSNDRIKNSQSRFVRISSEDKAIGTNNRFKVDLQSAGGVIDNVKGFVVHSIECPNVFNNITTTNNRIDVSFPGPHTETPFTISITPGYYLIDDLLTQINAQIAAEIASNGDTYTLVFSKVGIYPTERILVTVTGVSVGTLCLFNVSNDILSTLGIESDVNALPGSNPFCIDNAVPRLAQSIPNLIGETAVYVHSRILASNHLSEASGTFSVVDKLNLDQPYGSTCYSNFNNDTTHEIKYFPFETRKTLRTIDINLRNRKGDLLELPFNFEFSMMIKIFY